MNPIDFKREAATQRFRRFLIEQGLSDYESGLFEWDDEALLNGDPCYGRALEWEKQGIPDILNAILKMKKGGN